MPNATDNGMHPTHMNVIMIIMPHLLAQHFVHVPEHVVIIRSIVRIIMLSILQYMPKVKAAKFVDALSVRNIGMTLLDSRTKINAMSLHDRLSKSILNALFSFSLNMKGNRIAFSMKPSAHIVAMGAKQISSMMYVALRLIQ